MATNFPGSLDAFTNPTSGDTLDNPPHDQQHADVNDAVEAIETALLDGAPLHIDDANERVGIGTTSPNETLDVQGSIGFSTGGGRTAGSLFSDSNWGLITTAAQSSPGVAEFAWFNADDTERLRIDNSGNVGINDTTPSYTLDVNGDINATGDLRIGGAAIGTYTDYSSSVTFGGFSKGSSTVVASYTQIDKFVHYWGYVVLGSGFSMTGPLDVSLPVTANGGVLTTNSACSFYNGSLLFWGTALHISTAYLRLVAHAATSTYAYNSDVSGTVPFQWALNNVFYWNHCYQAA